MATAFMSAHLSHVWDISSDQRKKGEMARRAQDIALALYVTALLVNLPSFLTSSTTPPLRLASLVASPVADPDFYGCLPKSVLRRTLYCFLIFLISTFSLVIRALAFVKILPRGEVSFLWLEYLEER